MLPVTMLHVHCCAAAAVPSLQHVLNLHVLIKIYHMPIAVRNVMCMQDTGACVGLQRQCSGKKQQGLAVWAVHKLCSEQPGTHLL